MGTSHGKGYNDACFALRHTDLVSREWQDPQLALPVKYALELAVDLDMNGEDVSKYQTKTSF